MKFAHRLLGPWFLDDRTSNGRERITAVSDQDAGGFCVDV
jgi:hypothetical protein